MIIISILIRRHFGIDCTFPERYKLPKMYSHKKNVSVLDFDRSAIKVYYWFYDDVFFFFNQIANTF